MLKDLFALDAIGPVTCGPYATCQRDPRLERLLRRLLDLDASFPGVGNEAVFLNDDGADLRLIVMGGGGEMPVFLIRESFSISAS